MHPNPIFRYDDPDRTLKYARERSFGVVSINGENGPIAAHLPFVLSDDNSYLDAHVLRSNPIYRATKTAKPALLTISGPDAYISPDWYGIEDQVPTWNYIAVNLRGSLFHLPETDLRNVLDEISHHFESRLAPKPEWKADKMPADLLEKMMRMIVPIRMKIETVDSTWKLGQNKTSAARDAASDALLSSDIGIAVETVSQMMRNQKDEK